MLALLTILATGSDELTGKDRTFQLLVMIVQRVDQSKPNTNLSQSQKGIFIQICFGSSSSASFQWQDLGGYCDV